MNTFGAGARPVRILLVDRRPSVRRDLKTRLALKEDLEVVGEACDAVEANSPARALLPDVVLMDFEMSGTSAAAATGGPCGALHGAVVIFALRDAATRERARTADTASSVAKHRTEEILLAAIRGAAGAHAARRGRDRVSAGTEDQRGNTERQRREPVEATEGIEREVRAPTTIEERVRRDG